jgi:opacity protein-like surface antigen
MKKSVLFYCIVALAVAPVLGFSQIDQSKIGAWYMYFFNTDFNDGPWGLQGDIQYRSWNVGDDMEQLMLRGGITYSPNNANIKFTLGYANIQTGVYGESDATTPESRVYQEALFPTQVGKRFYFNHRIRYEQRFVQGQDFRTRYRYNLFLNVPITGSTMSKNTLYLALYNEIFINGERGIGNGRAVAIFDRNRFYTALGFVIAPNLKVQAGVMQQTTDNWKKTQAQLSLHHSF